MTPRALPDCPACDSAQTLSAVRADTHGLQWCECSCCSATVLVRPDGVAIWHSTPARVTDCQGHLIDGP